MRNRLCSSAGLGGTGECLEGPRDSKPQAVTGCATAELTPELGPDDRSTTWSSFAGAIYFLLEVILISSPSSTHFCSKPMKAC